MIGKYAQQRVTFGEPLAKRQAVQFAVADLYTKYQTGQLLTHRTAWKVDKGIASRHDAYMAKIFCTELGFEAADRCMQFHGAMGLIDRNADRGDVAALAQLSDHRRPGRNHARHARPRSL